jgi:hypothetical protein
MAPRTRAWIFGMVVALSATGLGCAMPEPIPLADGSVYGDTARAPVGDNGALGMHDGITSQGLDGPPSPNGDHDQDKSDMGAPTCPPTDAHVDGSCSWTRDGRVDGVGDGRTAQDGPTIVDGASPPYPDGLKKSDL